MSVSDTDKPEDPQPDNPVLADQEEGFTVEFDPLYVMQIKQPHGGWEQFNSARENRDEVTGIQAFHLVKNPEETPLRVWKRVTTLTLVEAPGHGEGHTHPDRVLDRNAEIVKRNTRQTPAQATE